MPSAPARAADDPDLLRGRAHRRRPPERLSTSVASARTQLCSRARHRHRALLGSRGELARIGRAHRGAGPRTRGVAADRPARHGDPQLPCRTSSSAPPAQRPRVPAPRPARPLPEHVEWSGGGRAVWTSDVPRDLTVDHVWFLQAKYDSTCVLNTAPGTLVDEPPGRRLPAQPPLLVRGGRPARSPAGVLPPCGDALEPRALARRRARHRRPAPGRHQGGAAVGTGGGRRRGARLRRALRRGVGGHHPALAPAAVERHPPAADPDAVPDAAHRRRSLLAARHQGLGAGASGCVRHPHLAHARAAAPRWSTPTPASPPGELAWAEVVERDSGERHPVEGCCEIRWSHGKLSGQPRAQGAGHHAARGHPRLRRCADHRPHRSSTLAAAPHGSPAPLPSPPSRWHDAPAGSRSPLHAPPSTGSGPSPPAPAIASGLPK